MKNEQNRFTPILIGAGTMIVLTLALVVASGPVYKRIAGRNIQRSAVPIYQAGTYEGSARGYGGLVTVRADFTEYGFDDVTIIAPDETPSLGKAAAVKLSGEMWRNQTYHVDSVSGATMTSNAIKKAMAESIREAAIEGTEFAAQLEHELSEENSETALPLLTELLDQIGDGSYTWTDSQADDNGFFSQIQVTVEDGRITALVWDAVNAEGDGKRSLSAAGQYNMTEDGPKWHEQADALAQYVMANQSEEGLLSSDGYASDAVSSVSIYSGGFLGSLKQCLFEAVQETKN